LRALHVPAPGEAHAGGPTAPANPTAASVGGNRLGWRSNAAELHEPYFQLAADRLRAGGADQAALRRPVGG
jgi:hypothetical protein